MRLPPSRWGTSTCRSSPKSGVDRPAWPDRSWDRVCARASPPNRAITTNEVEESRTPYADLLPMSAPSGRGAPRRPPLDPLWPRRSSGRLRRLSFVRFLIEPPQHVADDRAEQAEGGRDAVGEAGDDQHQRRRRSPRRSASAALVLEPPLVAVVMIRMTARPKAHNDQHQTGGATP